MLGYKLFSSGLTTANVAALLLDVGTSISAAGTTQGTATALTNTVNGISTVAAGAGVVLFTGFDGDCQIVFNGGANSVKVYPPSGAKINQMAANTPHVLGTNSGCMYWFLSSTQLFGILSA